MVKVISNIYINNEVKEAAKKQGLNISKVCEDALRVATAVVPHSPEQIQAETEAKLKSMDKEREEVAAYLTSLQKKTQEISDQEKEKILEAKIKKRANDERNKYFEKDRGLYNISYEQLKKEKKGKLPRDDYTRYKLINKRFKKNYKEIHGVSL